MGRAKRISPWKPTKKQTKWTVGIPRILSYEETKEYELIDASLQNSKLQESSMASHPWKLTEIHQSITKNGLHGLTLKFIDESTKTSSGSVIAVVKNNAGQTMQILQAVALTDTNGVAPVMFTFPRLSVGRYTASIFAIAPTKAPISLKTTVTL